MRQWQPRQSLYRMSGYASLIAGLAENTIYTNTDDKKKKEDLGIIEKLQNFRRKRACQMNQEQRPDETPYT